MKKLAVVLFSCLPLVAFAAGGGKSEYEVPAPVNLQDKVSLQNGAKLFVNYCMGCHGLQYQRYSRLAEDLEIPEELVQEKLNFTTDKVGDQMRTAMDPEDAKAWFGNAPPDLTMVTRYRSEDWVYSYLINFYEDESRPFGYNNRVFEKEFKQEMGDITNFLAYTAEPVRPLRERLGVYVLVFLGILFVPAYLLKKEYWKDVH